MTLNNLISYSLAGGCTNSWVLYSGFNAPGLIQQGPAGFYTQASCQAACIAAPSCNSIDYNNQDLTCWFGTQVTPPRVANTPVFHYDLTRNCGGGTHC